MSYIQHKHPRITLLALQLKSRLIVQPLIAPIFYHETR